MRSKGAVNEWHILRTRYQLQKGTPETRTANILGDSSGRVTHICVGNLTMIAPDNGSSPDRRQAIIWTNAGILLIGSWGTNLKWNNEILIGILTVSFKKMHMKMSSGKWRSSCLGLNVLTRSNIARNYTQNCSVEQKPWAMRWLFRSTLLLNNGTAL